MKAAQSYAWYANLCCQGVLLLLGMLWGRYHDMPKFVLWVGFSLTRSVALIAAGGWQGSNYFLIYLVTEPLLLLTMAYAVREAYLNQTRGYASMGNVGNWLLQGGVALSLIAAAVVFAADTGPWPQATVRAIVAARLAVFGFLAAFASCAALVFGIWRAPVSAPHLFRLFAAYLLLHSFGMIAAYWLGQEAVALVNVSVLSATAAIWLLWSWTLPQDMESEPPVSHTDVDPEIEREAQELLEETRRAASGR